MPVLIDCDVSGLSRDRLSGGEEEGRRARPPPTNKCAEWAVRFLADDNEGREALLQVRRMRREGVGGRTE